MEMKVDWTITFIPILESKGKPVKMWLSLKLTVTSFYRTVYS